MNADEIAERLNHEHIKAAAAWVYVRLQDYDCAIVHLEPGDATRYSIIVTTPQVAFSASDPSGETMLSDYTVTLANSFGQSYPWSGQRLHVDYVVDKWVSDDRLWTGVVLTEFLNSLANCLVNSEAEVAS